MSWVIKILLRDYTKISKTWNGSSFDEVNFGVGDFMLNDFKSSESTWREVNYSSVDQGDLVNRVSTSSTITMTSSSKRYQFIEPLVETVNLILPTTPRLNDRYVIKNLSEVNNKILIREAINSPVIITLDSVDEYTTLLNDGVEWHAII